MTSSKLVLKAAIQIKNVGADGTLFLQMTLTKEIDM